MKITGFRASNLLLAALLFFATAAAQAQLVSNLHSPSDGGYGGGPDSADDFTTGTEPLLVGRIQIQWDSGNGGINRIGIYTDNAGVPSTTQVGTFFTNGNPTVAGMMTYTGSASLAANTTYWMVVDIVDGSEVEFTFTNTVTTNPTTGGLTIPNGNSAFGDNVTGAWTNDPANLKFALLAPASHVPTMSEWALMVLALLMALTAFGFHARRED